MSLKETQVEDAGKDVSRHTEQERQVWLGEDPASTVHEDDAGTTSLAAASTSQGALRSAGGDGLDELPAGSSALSPIALVGRMSPSGLPALMLEEALQPTSTLDWAGEVGSQSEELSIRQRLDRIDARLEVLTKLSAPPVVDAPAMPEAVIAPDGPPPLVSKPHATTSATPKKWKHCPSLIPYLKGATMQNPLSDVDLQDAIRVETGYAPSLPALQNNLWKLVEEGRVNTYVRGRDGNLIPYRARRSKFKLFIVSTEAVNRASNPASLLPNSMETSPEPVGGGPIDEGAQDGLAMPLSPAATPNAAPDPVPEAAAPEVPLPPKKLTRWLRQLGIKKAGIQTGC